MSKAQEGRPTLKKALSSLDIFATGFGCLIGWGWIVAFGAMMLKAGAMGLVSGFVISGLLILTIGWVYAELSPAMPVTAGEIAFTLKALGIKNAYWSGWFMFISYIALAMFEAVSLPVIFGFIWPDVFHSIPLYNIAGFNVYLPQVAFGIAIVLIWAYLNYKGVKLYGWVQSIMVVMFLVIGLITVAISFINGNPQYFMDNMWGQLGPTKGIISVIALAGFFYVGFGMIPQASEEYSRNSRKLAFIILASILMGMIWYVLIASMIGLTLTKGELETINLPAAAAVAKTWGPAGVWIILFLGILGITTTFSASFYSSTRVLFGLGRGKLLPEFFQKMHPEYKTPVGAIIIVTFFSIIAILLGRAAVLWFLDATSAFIPLLWLYVAVDFVVLRLRKPNMKRPYKTPAGLLIGSIAIITPIIFLLALLLPMSPGHLAWPYEYAIFIIFLVLGVIFYIMMAPTFKKIPEEEFKYNILGEYAED